MMKNTRAPWHHAYIGLGSNLPPSASHVLRAVSTLHAHATMRVKKCSHLYISAPVECATAQADYINAVCKIKTALSSADLLAVLLQIEAAAGRVRTNERNAPRTLDLDLLLYGQQCIENEMLSVPHPRIAERRFVLEPLHEIAPAISVPGAGAVRELLKKVRHQNCYRLSDEEQ